jgi:hypothetical protein
MKHKQVTIYYRNSELDRIRTLRSMVKGVLGSWLHLRHAPKTVIRSASLNTF